MASKIQRWCVSQTVKGTATINLYDGTTAFNITIPEGVYWCDPVYGTMATSAAPSLYGQFAYQINANVTLSCTIDGVDTAGPAAYNFKGVDYNITGGAAAVYARPANCTTEGIRLLKALSLGAFKTATSTSYPAGFMEGFWRPNQGEYGSQQEQYESMSGTVRSFSGVAYGFRIGNQLRKRVIRFSGLPQALVWSSGVVQYGWGATIGDFSFESNIWKYASRGESVRVYDDESATHTYLSAAMTATAVSASVASGSGISDNTMIWIDGEQVYVEGGGGTTTLTVARPNPVAHSAYAPVSTDRVATYLLDNDGGQASMGEYAASRRAYNQTRYDLDVPLVRTVF